MKWPLGIFKEFPVPKFFEDDFNVSIVSDEPNLKIEDYLIPIDDCLKPLVDMKQFSPTAFGSLHLAFNIDKTDKIPSNFVKSMKCSPAQDTFQRLHFYIHRAASKDEKIFMLLRKEIKQSQKSSGPLLRPWCENLLPFVEVPEHSNVVYSNSEMIFVTDRYPKGSSHFLCLPRKRIDTWWFLTPQDIPLLQSMKSEAEEFAKRVDPSSQFKFGFHVIPSMKQLHLHIVNEDFASPNLTYAQWNAFNTGFLITIPQVIEELNTKGVIEMTTSRWEAYWSLLFGPLICCICHRTFRKVSVLQNHYKKEYNAKNKLNN